MSEKEKKLRDALVRLIGAGDPFELRIMAEFIRRDESRPNEDRAACLNAIEVLIETAE